MSVDPYFTPGEHALVGQGNIPNPAKKRQQVPLKMCHTGQNSRLHNCTGESVAIWHTNYMCCLHIKRCGKSCVGLTVQLFRRTRHHVWPRHAGVLVHVPRMKARACCVLLRLVVGGGIGSPSCTAINTKQTVGVWGCLALLDLWVQGCSRLGNKKI